MKKLISLTIFLVIICLLAPGRALAQGNTFEGSGFNSAEAAALAYIEAYNRGDLSDMLSTFAIESYVDNFNRVAYIKKINAIDTTEAAIIPLANHYIRELEIVNRYGTLANMLTGQYFIYNVLDDEYSDLIYGYSINFHSDEEVERFIYSMSNVPMTGWFGTIELKGFLSPEELSVELSIYDLPFNFYSVTNQRNIDRIQECLGADEIKEVIASIRINGNHAVQLLECVRYGDRWYNCSPGGNISNLLNMLPSIGGLVIYNENGEILRTCD